LHGKKAEGYYTDHHGLLMRVVLAADSLTEFIPRPVSRVHDPSQFPCERQPDGSCVARGGRVKPGEDAFEGDPQAAGKDLHLGVQGWLRRVRYAQEDIEEARGLVLGAFEGGVRSQFGWDVRGRAGPYPEANVRFESGRPAIDQALRQLGSLAGPSGDARVSSAVGGLAVDRVEGDVRIRLGAAQYESARARYEKWLAELRADAEQAIPAQNVAGHEAELAAARADRWLLAAAESAAPPAARAFRGSAFPLYPLLARTP
ncbi:MAG: hypothetical protein HY553_05690, partial [Elusimicrobia bacterium]|nr:hypothetical protein [Elusimicrobiota bacterium]